MWELDCEEGWVLKNWCFWTVVLEKTLESPWDCKEIQPVYSEGDQSWDFFGRNDAKAETLVLWPPHEKSWIIGKVCCWEGLGAGGEGDDRGWDGWMASLNRWTWVWVNSRSWWWTGRPGMLRFMGSQRVGQDWATDLIWSDLIKMGKLIIDEFWLIILYILYELIYRYLLIYIIIFYINKYIFIHIMHIYECYCRIYSQ